MLVKDVIEKLKQMPQNSSLHVATATRVGYLSISDSDIELANQCGQASVILKGEKVPRLLFWIQCVFHFYGCLISRLKYGFRLPRLSSYSYARYRRITDGKSWSDLDCAPKRALAEAKRRFPNEFIQ